MTKFSKEVEIPIKTKGAKKAEDELKGVNKETEKANQKGSKADGIFAKYGKTLGVLAAALGTLKLAQAGLNKIMENSVIIQDQLTIEADALDAVFNTTTESVQRFAEELLNLNEGTTLTGTALRALGAAVTVLNPKLGAYLQAQAGVADVAGMAAKEVIQLNRQIRVQESFIKQAQSNVRAYITEVRNKNLTDEQQRVALVKLNRELERFQKLEEDQIARKQKALELELGAKGTSDTRALEIQLQLIELEGDRAELQRTLQFFLRARNNATARLNKTEQENIAINTQDLIIEDLMIEQMEKELSIQQQLDQVEKLRLSTTKQQTQATKEQIQAEQEKSGNLLQQIGIIGQLLSFIPGLGSIVGTVLRGINLISGFSNAFNLGGSSVGSVITPGVGAAAAAAAGGGLGPVLVIEDVLNAANRVTTTSNNSKL